jgi:hypothetical protein
MAADNEPQQGATESSVEMKSSLNVAGKFKGLLDKVKKPDTKSKAGNVLTSTSVNGSVESVTPSSSLTFSSSISSNSETESRISGVNGSTGLTCSTALNSTICCSTIFSGCCGSCS